MKRVTLVILAMAIAVLFSPRISNAQTVLHDHLKCYKIKDKAKFTALVDLAALQTQFPDEQCRVIGKGKLFCVPVDKSVTSFKDLTKTGIPQVALDGDEQTFDRVCYKIKCPKVAIDPLAITDQFGSRTVGRFRPFMLCAPAIKGVPPQACETGLSGQNPGQCGGTCPTNFACDDDIGQVNCKCFPTVCALDPASGQCGGPCSVVGQTCLPDQLNACVCQ